MNPLGNKMVQSAIAHVIIYFMVIYFVTGYFMNDNAQNMALIPQYIVLSAALTAVDLTILERLY